MIDAEYIIKSIGEGVRDALNAKKLFLGIEKFEFSNPDIRPEYLMTVKVAEQLACADHEVELEASMNKVRHLAEAIVRIRSGGRDSCRQRRRELLEGLGGYEFGKRRLDIIVHSNQNFAPPVLVAEAKLGVGNRKGIVRDIERVFRLLNMFHEVKALKKDLMYGAVLFHLMVDSGGSNELTKESSSLLVEVKDYLRELSCKNPWLKHKAGFLRSFDVTEPAKGSGKCIGGGLDEHDLAKDKFAFSPGLVLLGNANDISGAQF